jgi:hypothetical protein
MKTLSQHAHAAKNIRRDLKIAFPDIAFKVTSKSYSGGNSVSVHWSMGPTSDEVRKIIEPYEQGTFDGMTDSYDYDYSEAARKFHDENGSIKFVHWSRDIPEDIYRSLIRDYCNTRADCIYEEEFWYNIRSGCENVCNIIRLILPSLPGNGKDFRLCFTSDPSIRVDEWLKPSNDSRFSIYGIAYKIQH